MNEIETKLASIEASLNMIISAMAMHGGRVSIDHKDKEFRIILRFPMNTKEEAEYLFKRILEDMGLKAESEGDKDGEQRGKDD